MREYAGTLNDKENQLTSSILIKMLDQGVSTRETQSYTRIEPSE
jgi:hypothetical protein